MLNYLSYGVKIWTDLSSVLSQYTRVTDRQTYRILTAIPRLHYMQCGKTTHFVVLQLTGAQEMSRYFTCSFCLTCSEHRTVHMRASTCQLIAYHARPGLRLSAAGCVIIYHIDSVKVASYFTFQNDSIH